MYCDVYSSDVSGMRLGVVLCLVANDLGQRCDYVQLELHGLHVLLGVLHRPAKSMEPLSDACTDIEQRNHASSNLHIEVDLEIVVEREGGSFLL